MKQFIKYLVSVDLQLSLQQLKLQCVPSSTSYLNHINYNRIKAIKIINDEQQEISEKNLK